LPRPQGDATAKARRLHDSSPAIVGGSSSKEAIMRAVTSALLVALALAATPLNAQTPDPPRAFLLFVDDLHLDFRETPRTRALMQRLFRDVARAGDIWAVTATGTSSLSLAPTKDLAAVKATVSRITGNSLKPSERLGVQRGSNTAGELQHRVDIAYETGARAIEGLSKAAPGTTLTVFVVSGGYDTRVVDGPQRLIDAAKRAGATVVTLQPWAIERSPATGITEAEWQAYQQAAQASLRALATETGGATITTRDEVESVLQRFAKP
jgi:hypothetical protein